MKRLSEKDFLCNRSKFYLEIYDMSANTLMHARAQTEMFLFSLALAEVGSEVLYFDLKERHKKERI